VFLIVRTGPFAGRPLVVAPTYYDLYAKKAALIGRLPALRGA